MRSGDCVFEKSEGYEVLFSLFVFAVLQAHFDLVSAISGDGGFDAVLPAGRGWACRAGFDCLYGGR